MERLEKANNLIVFGGAIQQKNLNRIAKIG
jgi:hypothetical protein